MIYEENEERARFNRGVFLLYHFVQDYFSREAAGAEKHELASLKYIIRLHAGVLRDLSANMLYKRVMSVDLDDTELFLEEEKDNIISFPEIGRKNRQ